MVLMIWGIIIGVLLWLTFFFTIYFIENVIPHYQKKKLQKE